MHEEYILIHKNGYYDAQLQLKQSMQPIAFLNTIIPIFWFIDLNTGSILKYNKKKYNVQLQKK